MNGDNRQRRNAFALAISTAAHLIFLGMVINQSSDPYDLTQPAPAPEPPAPAMEVEIVRLPPTLPQPPVPAPTPATPQPPVAWPHPDRMKVLPPLPPTPTPTPTARLQPAPAPLAPAPIASPIATASTPAPAAAAVAPRRITLAERKLLQAAQAARAAPVARAAPLGALNIHMPALAPPAGVPTLPVAGGPAAKLAGGGARGGGIAGGAAAGQRGVGLSSLPYGYMPSGGSGLRGTLVGCANADAVRLSGAERDRCNERFGVEVGAAPKLDPIAGSRAGFDKAAAREAREQRYRASTTDMDHDPSLPGGIAAGPASSETFKHNAGDPK